MTWAHRHDEEWRVFTAGNASGGGELLFGRVTYEMMASFWPTPLALEAQPVVAERMNASPKVVFSRTLSEASWTNTRLVRGGLAESVRDLKAEDGPDLVVFGSGSIVAQLADTGLVDLFQIVVIPVALGAGRTMFAGLRGRLALRLEGTRVFGNGNVLLRYRPEIESAGG